MHYWYVLWSALYHLYLGSFMRSSSQVAAIQCIMSCSYISRDSSWCMQEHIRIHSLLSQNRNLRLSCLWFYVQKKKKAAAGTCGHWTGSNRGRSAYGSVWAEPSLLLVSFLYRQILSMNLGLAMLTISCRSPTSRLGNVPSEYCVTNYPHYTRHQHYLLFLCTVG